MKVLFVNRRLGEKEPINSLIYSYKKIYDVLIFLFLKEDVRKIIFWDSSLKEEMEILFSTSFEGFNGVQYFDFETELDKDSILDKLKRSFKIEEEDYLVEDFSENFIAQIVGV